MLHAYRPIWRRRGVRIGWITAPAGDAPVLLASCDPAVVTRLLRQGPDVGRVPGCAAVARR